MWMDQEEDVKEGEEGCRIDGATESDYIHNQDE
jgi:hypothetical protein